ncbi:adenosine deaminase-like protein-like [Mucor ambiguus]|uniref:Adenosine deaminase-like protein-like n=1 Tax=Mucor ambiguus TaxID=91626 RepID=A0A0C9LPH9_9FUNG|nr:adenosine deaminase-like protein-like [Mucor ambiguus]
MTVPSLAQFCVQLPKVELHAHLNGSLSPATMRELVERKKADKPELADFQIPDSLDRIDDFFRLFKFIYQLTDDEESIRVATRNIINEFAKDNVKYLELRTTPRKNDETVTSVIQEARDDIIVKLIVSIDRRNNLEEAQEVVDLALAFRSQGVVGVDLCGDVKVGLFENLKPAFERAKQHGFPLTLHFNEVLENVAESASLLSIQPNRLGHATFLDDYCRKTIYGQNIPIEICMTSNILCKTVKTVEEHHIKELLVDNHPFILCTDDKGVFFSESSNEYKLAAETFSLSKEELFTITLRSVDAIFADDTIKQSLKQDFLRWKEEHQSEF